MIPGLPFNFSAAKRNAVKSIRSPGRSDARNARTKIKHRAKSIGHRA